jgi:hypothetical protein
LNHARRGTPDAARHSFHLDDAGAVYALGVAVARALQETLVMKKNLLLIAVLAVMLAGCVVVPGRPLYVHAPGVVVY